LKRFVAPVLVVLGLVVLGAAPAAPQGTKPAAKPAAPAPRPATTGTTPARPATSTPRPRPSGGTQRLDGIAAVVNDEVVLQSDVEEQLYLFLMKAQTEVDSQTVDTLRTQILNQLIDEKLIVAEAKRQGVTVPEAEVNRQANEVLREVKGRFDNAQAYQDQLRKENMTEDKLLERFRDEARRSALVQRLVAKQVPKRTPSQTEAETYFKAHKDKFPKAPAEVRLSVIQIPATADSASEAAARAKAEAIRKRIAGGEKFAKVAAEASEDETSAKSGGDLGYLVKGTMDPTFEKEVFEGKLNTLSEPIRTLYGWHIIETLDRDTLKTAAGRDSVDRNGLPLLEAHVRHILIRVPLDDEDVARAKATAEKARAEALKTGDFAAAAKKYSRYAGPHADDGDIGFLSVASLQPNIRAGLDTVKVGGISDVLVNQAGFNVFKVTDKKPEHEYQLDEIKNELPNAVGEILFREQLDTWVKGLRAKAQIKINKS
jgi:peptidyl-prolyl cis-trans isomerase SurA